MDAPQREPADSGQFAFEGLDRVLHEKARLGILSSLIANPKGLVFTELKSLCSLTDGNLSRHMQVLQDAGLVEVWKGTQGNRPQTLVRLTEEGRARFMEYIGVLEQIVTEAVEASEAARPAPQRVRNGWSSA
jgi:DNA-binding MarR family transcriptional regulator